MNLVWTGPDPDVLAGITRDNRAANATTEDHA